MANLDTWQDRGSVVADPLFANASSFDFRLSPLSPALALGFVPFSVADAGPSNPPAWQPRCLGPHGPVTSCGAPLLAGGRVYGADFSCGASVRVVCFPGYVLAGPVVLTCSGQGWGTLPECRPVE